MADDFLWLDESGVDFLARWQAAQVQATIDALLERLVAALVLRMWAILNQRIDGTAMRWWQDG